ncbi:MULTISPECIES: GntR family transcriptional regulator [Micrococcaceae]|uniref:GntR family transcriptional regulator n=1 Tax=Glutamicibacter ectropisis TaxID=3046593 RepID=A0AAU6WH24_9MICC|nr:GntR family transcriptional regulator [Arthrobacter sp. NIO-1057]SCB73080.1 DNA-binding transcriptional regulator YhcF, GntR family [Arthrobacter sp. NIO-1057]
MIDDSKPIFIQIAELIENDIVSGVLAEEAQVPSTNEFAAFYRINPATAAKGINRLVEDGLLYKKRGIGMFVTEGAPQRLREQRREKFQQQFITPLTAEASKLGIGINELVAMIKTSSDT